jgi:hypothetical protein
MKEMVNNSTNMNRMNDHLSPKLAEHTKKKTTTYDVENPGPGQAQNMAGLNRLIISQPPLMITGYPTAILIHT